MTTLEADNFQEFAKHSIHDFGADIILRKTNGCGYDITSGTVIQDATDYAIKGLIENYSEYFMQGSLVQMGDRKITIATSALTVTPEQGDSVLIGGLVYNVVDVKAEFCGDIPIIYVLHIRK